MIEDEVLLIVLTGGPDAVKTTSVSQLMEWLTGLGYRVLIVPESASELIASGIRPQNFDNPLAFQHILIKNIIHKEELFAAAVSDMIKTVPHKPTILLCSTGIMDVRAYTEEEDFQTILYAEGLNLADACDRRYAGVIHLRTAADGAEENYALSNNSAQMEPPDVARLRDQATEQAWRGHPRLSVIDNSTSFEGKILRTKQAVSSILGIPGPTEYERKFLLIAFGKPFTIPVPNVEVEIEQYYLKGGKERIRMRTRQGASTFFHTIKENLPGLERIKIDRIISKREFYELLLKKDPARGVVKKTRTHFVWENQYFELDRFHHNGMWLLEARLSEGQKRIALPFFLPEMIDVTDDPHYYNYNIAASISR